MLSAELINDLIPPLKSTDSGDKALALMNDFKVSHLPIVNEQQFLGLISEDELIEMEDPSEPISNVALHLAHSYVHAWQHIYDAMKLMSAQKLSIVPVLDNKENYLGMISINTMLNYFSEITSLASPGAIIILEIGQRNYSLSEIARIVESNDAHILSSYLNSNADSTKIEVTLKVDKEDINGIIQTFERFNYTVHSFYKQKMDIDDTMDRFESFMKYLNI
jgi:acetoin utilization protein AcuB